MDLEAEYERLCKEPCDINEHLPTLLRYASECQHVTEFGVRSGNSTRAFMAAKPDVLVSYDLNEDANVRRFFTELEADGFPYEYIIGDVLEAEIDGTDLLFIDTWHSFDQLSAELDKHAFLVRRWIIMHDTETYGINGEDLPHKHPTGGLLQALGQFLVTHPEWRVKEHFRNNNGLTVLERIPINSESEEEASPQILTWRQRRGLD